jgi:hypothetical protein
MISPTFLLGFLISTFYGAAFHLWRGGGIGRLIFYLILAWCGFWTGQLFASQIGFNLWGVGSLHLGIATLFSLLFLAVGYWLSLIDKDKHN